VWKEHWDSLPTAVQDELKRQGVDPRAQKEEEEEDPLLKLLQELKATQGESWLDTELAAAFLEDVAAQHQNVDPAEDLVFVSANITTCFLEIFRWHQPGQGPLLIQELHLGDEGVGKVRIDAHPKGYHLFLPPVEGPCRADTEEDTSLRPGVGLTGGPNPQILARLLPLLKQGANWIVAGDWNYPSQELEDTSLPASFRGKVVAPGEATISTGNCLDFAIASLRIAPLIQCSANWSVPFRPHAAVVFRLATSGGQAVAEARDRETQDYQRLGPSCGSASGPVSGTPKAPLPHFPPPIPELKERATQQAMALPALGGVEFEKLIRSMPSKAAGLDGWSVDLLKSLDAGEVASLASLWREIEVTGELPTQMTFTAFIMLAKTETIERPIGLMSTLLKLGMKARWGLIEQWLVEYRDHLWWDCALPSRSTHDASLRRGFAYE
ncbi:unnamed protein product, partial [Symbiodinium microadriaticum]